MNKRALTGVLMAASTLVLGSVAKADVVSPPGDFTFTFSGQCADCTGYGTGTLQVQDYSLGTSLTDANLVDFTYSSNLTSFDINPVNDDGLLSHDSLSGSITTAPGYYSIDVAQNFLIFTTAEFTSGTDGTWNATVNQINLDSGTHGNWNGPTISAAPEPSIWLLIFAGVGGIGVMLRRAKRTMGFRFKDAFSA